MILNKQVLHGIKIQQPTKLQQYHVVIIVNPIISLLALVQIELYKHLWSTVNSAQPASNSPFVAKCDKVQSLEITIKEEEIK